MGQKADTLNRELIPTRTLLRWLADQVGVSIEYDNTSVADQVRYQGMLEQALASGTPRSPSMPLRDEPPLAVDEVVAAEGGALVPRPDTSGRLADDVDMVDQIAKIVGVASEGSRRDKLEGLHGALEHLMGGGDVEVPKGDSLADAMKFGHDQNHQLRDRLREAEMLIQRVAGSLQVTLINGDGTPVLDAVQRFELAKLAMRRRILELRATERTMVARGVASREWPARPMADELELAFTSLLSPAEQSAWSKTKGSSPVTPEHPPHPFEFVAED